MTGVFLFNIQVMETRTEAFNTTTPVTPNENLQYSWFRTRTEAFNTTTPMTPNEDLQYSWFR
jgi:hypothetical protein